MTRYSPHSRRNLRSHPSPHHQNPITRRHQLLWANNRHTPPHSSLGSRRALCALSLPGGVTCCRKRSSTDGRVHNSGVDGVEGWVAKSGSGLASVTYLAACPTTCTGPLAEKSHRSLHYRDPHPSTHPSPHSDPRPTSQSGHPSPQVP